jgi:mevalonate pyrophosphate decarboxylase
MNSSTTRGMRWISSMNSTDPSSRLVRNGSMSAGRASAGPLVI